MEWRLGIAKQEAVATWDSKTRSSGDLGFGSRVAYCAGQE
jgi:hypothetical protein